VTVRIEGKKGPDFRQYIMGPSREGLGEGTDQRVPSPPFLSFGVSKRVEDKFEEEEKR